MVAVDECPLDRRRLHQVLGHMGRPEVGAPRLGLKLGLDINA